MTKEAGLQMGRIGHINEIEDFAKQLLDMQNKEVRENFNKYIGSNKQKQRTRKRGKKR